MTPTSAPTQDIQIIEQKALTLPEQAQNMLITDQASYTLAATTLLDVAALRREIQDYHKPLKAAADKAHKLLCAAETKLLTPVSLAESLLKARIAAYEREQAQIHLRLKLQAEQEERERAERERREKAELVGDRITDLTIGLEMENAQSWEEAEEIARRAREAGQKVAEEIRQEPLVVHKVDVPEIERVKGVGTVGRWSAVVDNLKELCRAIGAGEPGVSVEMVLPNMTALNKMAGAMKQHMNVPGVRAVKETGVRTGR